MYSGYVGCRTCHVCSFFPILGSFGFFFILFHQIPNLAFLLACPFFFVLAHLFLWISIILLFYDFILFYPVGIIPLFHHVYSNIPWAVEFPMYYCIYFIYFILFIYVRHVQYMIVICVDVCM